MASPGADVAAGRSRHPWRAAGAYLAVITPQAIGPPEFPEGWVT